MTILPDFGHSIFGESRELNGIAAFGCSLGWLDAVGPKKLG
jgi:hypothetical protein